MREFQEKKRFRRFLYSKGMVALLLIMAIFFGRATWNLYKKAHESAANASQAQNALKRLEDRQKVLNEEISRLKTDEGIEAEIRSKYGVSKPGEQVLIIVDDQKATTTEVREEEGWWQKFKEAFN
jgi:cell division protein FtsB